MKLRVSPSRLSGTVNVPPSKSVFQRAVASAALSDHKTRIYNPSFSDDGIAALRIAEALGCEVTSTEEWVEIKGLSHPLQKEWNVGESGLSARMFTPIAALFDEKITITGEGSLLKRPVGVYNELLAEHGCEIESHAGKLPLQIKGPLQAGHYEFDASMSSQHLTGLLMALPLCKGSSVVEANNLNSGGYIDMTIELLNDFGVLIDRKDQIFRIEGNQEFDCEEMVTDGDWSAGATLLAAGAVAGSGYFEVAGLKSRYTQPDSSIAGILLFAGAKIKNQEGDYQVTSHKIKGINYDATNSPDLFPVLAALGAMANSESRIKGIHRLKHKESDRAQAILDVLNTLNVKACLEGDELVIPGNNEIRSGRVKSHGDHRIAMMACILGLGGAEVVIEGAEAVNKSYPNFYADLIDLGARIKVV